VDIWTLVLTAIVAGGVAGSLINVIASRLPAESEPAIVGAPFRPGSETADPFGLIPFVGAWQRAMGAIDWPKLATDIGAAAIVVIALWRHDFSFDALRAALFALALLVILRIDWQNHLIFTITIVPAIVVALALQAFSSTDELIWSLGAMAGAGLLFLGLFFLALVMYGKRALGMGDIWLAALIGAMTGENVITALILGMFLAGFGGLFLIAIRVRSRTDYIPYGAYLCLGAIITVLLLA
jgi:leader peptidase (prepilin peptidase)/N-methyltransferase